MEYLISLVFYTALSRIFHTYGQRSGKTPGHPQVAKNVYGENNSKMCLSVRWALWNFFEDSESSKQKIKIIFGDLASSLPGIKRSNNLYDWPVLDMHALLLELYEVPDRTLWFPSDLRLYIIEIISSAAVKWINLEKILRKSSLFSFRLYSYKRLSSVDYFNAAVLLNMNVCMNDWVKPSVYQQEFRLWVLWIPTC